jgi:very-short-patch-repair endonuclease
MVVPQWPVGAYRIDMVVVGSDDRLAIECDGERYHTHVELERDIERQMVLERLGWKFERIRGSLFFRDPEQAMKPIIDRLCRLAITPRREDAKAITTQNVHAPDLIRELNRIAVETRTNWDANKS